MSCSSCSIGAKTCGPSAVQNLYSNAVPWAPSALPYTTTPASNYRRLCFAAPYATNCNEPSTSCVTTMSTRSGALFNEECASGRAINGQCASFSSAVPRATGSVSDDDLARYVYATTGGQGFAAAAAGAAGTLRCANPLVTVEQNGQKHVVCPIAMSNDTAPQCTQALQRVWQPERFKGVDTEKFNAARQMQDCFVYSTVFPNGQTQPVAVKATPQCMAAAQVAFAKVSNSCASCSATGFCN